MHEPESRDVQAQSPPGLVFAAVAIGGLGIGFGIAATVLMLKSQDAVTAPSASVAIPLPAPLPSPSAGPWTDELHAEVCAAPCCGGAACRVSAENAGKKACKDGETHCEACTSKLSCIPGACGELVEADVELALHLSSVFERGGSGEALDACKSRRDLWLCVKRVNDSEWQCLSQRESCSNQSRSPASVSLRAGELTRRGLEFEVREGGPDGERLAHEADPLYKSPMQRRGLCSGFRGEFEPGPVSSFTFFLDLPAGPDAPAPVRVPVEKSDAGVGGGASLSPEPSAAAAVLTPPAPAGSAQPASP